MDSASYGEAVDANPIAVILRTSIGSVGPKVNVDIHSRNDDGNQPVGEIPRHSFHEEYPT